MKHRFLFFVGRVIYLAPIAQSTSSQSNILLLFIEDIPSKWWCLLNERSLALMEYKFAQKSHDYEQTDIHS